MKREIQDKIRESVLSYLVMGKALFPRETSNVYKGNVR